MIVAACSVDVVLEYRADDCRHYWAKRLDKFQESVQFAKPPHQENSPNRIPLGSLLSET